jgi:hypothetical protein
LARSNEFGSGLGLDLHVRTEIKDGWSFISNAALRIGEDIFEVAKDGTYYLNGIANLPLPALLAGTYKVSKEDSMVDTTESDGTVSSSPKSFFHVDMNDGENLGITLYKDIISTRINAFLHDAEGMLGTHSKDGMVGRNEGTVFDDVNQFGLEWQVNNTERMMFHTIRAPQFPEQCILPTEAQTTRRRLRVRNSDDEHRHLAELACAGVVDIAMREFCLEDVMLTGDQGLASNYGEAF